MLAYDNNKRGSILLPRHKQEIKIVSSMEEWQLRDKDRLFSGEAILGIKKEKFQCFHCHISI